MDFDISRSSEVFNPAFIEKPIYIIGCGATGSRVAELLCRFGVQEITCIDGDDVENVNLNNQFFDTSCVGLNKADAVKKMCKAINPNITVNVVDRYITPEDIKDMSGYVFCLVDSMSLRKEFFEVAKNNPKIDWYWETRLGSNQARVYCLPISEELDYSKYEKMHFYRDEDAEVSACGTSITIVSIVMATAALAVNQLIKIVMNKEQEEPYLSNYTLFDNMYGVYTENFFDAQEAVKAVEEVTDEIYL